MKESIALLQIKDTNELDQIDFKEGPLRSFLAQRHPHWLQKIVDRQYRHWRDTQTGKLLQAGSAGHDCQRTAALRRSRPDTRTGPLQKPA